MATGEAEVRLAVAPTPIESETEPSIPSPIELFGMPFHALTFERAVAMMIDMARGDQSRYVVTANVDHVIRFSRQPDVRRLYTQADLVVADGMPLIWASRLLGMPLPERVAGSDLMPALCAAAESEGLSVFFLGGADDAAEAAARVLKTRHPALKIAGIHVPPFGFERDAEASKIALDAVRSARPDILFVGLGSPKQEHWIAAHRETCGAKLSIGVGITFSFVAGRVQRAPRWMQRCGLEWLHRLCQEPRRLWKRYLVDDTAFAWLVLKQLWFGPH